MKNGDNISKTDKQYCKSTNLPFKGKKHAL